MDTLIPALIASRYRPLRELGRGGMGVVYLVEHVHTGDHLALKLLVGAAAQDSGSIARFKREARASARINSEYVVKVVDADVAAELEGAPFLVMELLNGIDLQKQLRDRGRFPADEAALYLTQAARGLDKSHAIGIIHRDLKPENLFLHRREDGSTILKILDFGISKIIGGDAANDMNSASMTGTGMVMGTPLYMSPEQARGRVGEIGPRSDVWAMGLITMQLLTGEIYWRARTVGELMAQIIAEPLYAPSQRWGWLPRAIDEWFARACAREPGDRFASVGEEVEALREVLGVEARSTTAAGARGFEFGRDPSMGAATVREAPLAAARTTNGVTAGDKGEVGAKGRVQGLVGGGVILAVALAGVMVFAWRLHTPAREVVLEAGAGAAVDAWAGVVAAGAVDAGAPAAVVEKESGAEGRRAGGAQATAPEVGAREGAADGGAARTAGKRKKGGGKEGSAAAPPPRPYAPIVP